MPNRRWTFALLVMLAACWPAGAQEPVPQWEQQARERIERHRKGDFTVRIVDAEGNPVPDLAVRVEMTRHAFGFGTAINAGTLAETDEDHPYRHWAKRLFNRGTLENHHKWNWQTRPERIELADAAVGWMREAGWDIRGHALIWATDKYGAVPDDIRERVADETVPVDLRGREIRERTLAHIATVAERYRGRVREWDVVNEHHAEHLFSDLTDPDAPTEEAPILLDWFAAAHVADPGAKLYVNDFHILVGDHPKHKESYERLIRFLRDHDAPLHGVGFQGHFYHGSLRRTPEQLYDTLDRYALDSLELQVTEFDTFGQGWGETRDEQEQNQARFLREFYITCFSHPAVNGITMWGFWDGRHWANTAPLFREDWTPKPALAVYRDLVFNRWWTRTEGRTDANGQLRFRGFHGDYRLVAEVNGQETQTRIPLRQDGASAQWQLPAP